MRGFIVALALAGAFLFALANIAGAHWKYEAACCSDKDCAPVADSEVSEVAGGYLITATGEVVKHGSYQIRKPLDEQYHLCRHVTTGALLCLYPKLQGF